MRAADSAAINNTGRSTRYRLRPVKSIGATSLELMRRETANMQAITVTKGAMVTNRNGIRTV